MPCPVIIPIQPLLVIILLAVVFVRLNTGTCKNPAERIVMIYLLYRARRVNDYPVVPLMVLQKVVVFFIREGDIPFLRQQVLWRAIFIDHIPAVIRCGGRTAYLVHNSQLGAVSCIGVGNGTSIRKGNCTWQI